jgi:hypothetical protein
MTGDQQWPAYTPVDTSGAGAETTGSGDVHDTWQYPAGGTQGTGVGTDTGTGTGADMDASMGGASADSGTGADMSAHSGAGTTIDTGEGAVADDYVASADAMQSGPSSVDEALQIPPTEDTMAVSAAADTMGAADEGGLGSQDAGGQMPGVVPIEEEAPPPYPTPATYADVSPAASGSAVSAQDEAAVPVDTTAADAPAAGGMATGVATGVATGMDDGAATAGVSGGGVTGGTTGGGGGAWASTALSQLDQAQQALSGGDWARFGQAMASLRSLLESASGGVPAPQMGSATYAPSGTSTYQPASTGFSAPGSPAVDMGSYSGPAADVGTAASAAGAIGGGTPMDSYRQEGPAPTLEPAAEAGTLGATPGGGIMPTGADVGVGAGVSPGLGAAGGADIDMMGGAGAVSMMPSQDGTVGTGMARLVVISTGAELPLPEQEEITVGREDPSSGIFPDVDLTPYGGEEGGVSRRHARLLFLDGEYYVEDLQSTNYTKIDGQRLPAHVREKVEDGARLDFGRVAVIFRRS